MSVQIEPTRFRRVLGHYPTGVCVVTAHESGGPLGMAVGSFTSVSLDPPLVAFLPDRSSKSWQKIRSAGRFCVNVLAEDQEHICGVFATSGIDKFADIEWELSERGLPVLSGATAWLECDVDAVHEAGDHDIVIGRVIELDVARPCLPLLFFQGGYGRFHPSSMVSADAQLVAYLRKADAARSAMEDLADAVGVACDASVVLGEELVIIASAGQPRTVLPTGAIGVRVPFVPPIGLPFVAWNSDAAAAWLRTGEPPLSTRESEMYIAALESVREGGCAIATGRAGQRLAEEIASGALETATAREVGRCRRQTSVLSPADLVADRRYDLETLTAPVFDEDGGVSLVLTLVGFDRECTGAEIEHYAEMLIQASHEITAGSGGRSPESNLTPR